MRAELFAKPDFANREAFSEWAQRAAEFVGLATAAAEAKEEAVYFIVAGPFLKIGKCTGHPRERLAQLQTGCPYEMDLAFWLPGGRDVEGGFHQRFVAQRLLRSCEWFRLEGDLAEFVAAASDFRVHGEALLDAQETECAS